MNIANFYPGPSRVYSNIPEYIYEAYMSGYMSSNHRSPLCMELFAEVKQILKDKLLIPESYEIAFTSSATENWEIIAQSLTARGSFHFYNGAFGEKWFGYAHNLVKAEGHAFDIDEELTNMQVPEAYDVICVTQCETSNGTAVSNDRMKSLRQAHPEHVIAVDVTSSLGGMYIDFEQADYWYASVQKCLGLPAGLAVVIMSPKAIAQAKVIGENNRYNSLLNIIENTQKNQTHHTPNVLGIYLLKRTQEISKGIAHIQNKCEKRVERYAELIESLPELEFLVKNEKVRAQTVMAISHQNPKKILKGALDYGITLGAGYGPWKPTTFRVANFPAIKSREIEKLYNYLSMKCR